MKLRGTRVFARADSTGQLLAERGRVEIRYRPEDGRAYHASKENLEPIVGEVLLTDDHCAPAQATRKPVRGAVATPPPPAPDGAVVIYADGACRGNPGPAGLGVIVLADGKRQELSEYLGEGTNNIAELTAILRGLEAVSDRTAVVRVYTDSSYAIGVLTQGWKAKANKELIANIKQEMKNFEDLGFVHVRGHSGIPLNERADELATGAAETHETTAWKVV